MEFAEYVLEIFRKELPDEKNLDYKCIGDLLFITKKNSPQVNLAKGLVKLNEEGPMYAFRGLTDKGPIYGFIEYGKYIFKKRNLG